MLAPIMTMPLIEPLPGGARGLVLLTGDDDQAFLDKYDQQLRAIGTTPITYYLVPQTRHTPQTLGALPSTVDFGVHPDALERPDLYDSACAEQTAFVRGLTGRACRTVRNHGYLNRGYLGHLQAWESNGLELDLNLPGVDGTALNGSFLPMRVRRPDGSWSSHFTLLTAFGDGMMLALNMSARAACRSITRLAQQVERDAPAVLVFNLHPQNISQTVALHKKVRWLCARPGWRAMSVERYLDWVKRLDQVCVQHHGGGWTIRSEEPVEGLVMSVQEVV